MTDSNSRPPNGILYVIGGVLCLSISDALAKGLGASYPAIQLLFLRGLIAVPIVVAVILWREGYASLFTRNLRVHCARGLMNVTTACAFYFGLTMLPLADATAIAFSAPIFVIVLSSLFLKEPVDARRWCAALAGFGGVLIFVRPGASSFHAATLLPLCAAIGYALMMLTSRHIKGRESMLTTMLYIVLAQVAFSILLLPWFWVTPLKHHLPAFAALSLFSTLGLSLITRGFQIGPASIVAPFDYTGLLWAGLMGWLFWNELPDSWAYLGGAIIVSSGLYIAQLEARRRS